MKKIIFYTLFYFGLFYSLNSNGQVFDKNELEVKIDALIPTSVNDSTPGLVIGIVKKGELIFLAEHIKATAAVNKEAAMWEGSWNLGNLQIKHGSITILLVPNPLHIKSDAELGHFSKQARVCWVKDFVDSIFQLNAHDAR